MLLVLCLVFFIYIAFNARIQRAVSAGWELKMESISIILHPRRMGGGARAQKTYYFPIDLNFNDVFIRLH